MTVETISVLDHTWHVIANPNACEKKSLNRWSKVAKRFDEVGLKYEFYKADDRGMGIALASRLCQEGHQHLIVVGGDGTINEVVNGIMSSGVDVHDVCLAVIPLGRGNDWTRTHQYPDTLEACVEMFLCGGFLRHDVGKVRTFIDEREVAQRFFINIAGFGFDAEVIYDDTYNKPHFIGISTYILSVLRCLFGSESPEVEVSAEGFLFKDRLFSMVAGICQYNGGGMRQAPTAIPNDGLLDLVIIPKVSIFRVLRLLAYVFSGRHIEKSKGLIKVCQTEEASFVCKKLLRGEVEGELLETGNYKVSVVPHAFRMLTNKAWPE